MEKNRRFDALRRAYVRYGCVRWRGSRRKLQRRRGILYNQMVYACEHHTSARRFGNGTTKGKRIFGREDQCESGYHGV